MTKPQSRRHTAFSYWRLTRSRRDPRTRVRRKAGFEGLEAKEVRTTTVLADPDAIINAMEPVDSTDMREQDTVPVDTNENTVSRNGIWFAIDDTSLRIYRDQSTLVVEVSETNGRPDLIASFSSDRIIIIDDDSVRIYDLQGSEVLHLKDRHGRAQVQHNELTGQFWIVDDHSVTSFDQGANELTRIEGTVGRAKIVFGEDGAYWVVDSRNVFCFDKDGKKI
jgi:hypothetical protein